MNSHLTQAMITTNHQQLVRDAEHARLAAEVVAGPSLLSRVTTAVRSAAVMRRPASGEAPSGTAAVVSSPIAG